MDRVDVRVDVAVGEQVRLVDFGAVLAAEGVTTVALRDDGRLVRYQPNGTATPVD